LGLNITQWRAASNASRFTGRICGVAIIAHITVKLLRKLKAGSKGSGGVVDYAPYIIDKLHIFKVLGAII
jgi:hypothetical protein